MSQLLISLNGIDERVLKKNINGVLISETDRVKVVEKYTLLQANFSSIDDLIKAKHIINDQIKIDKSRIFIETFSEESTVKFINSGYKVIANIDFLKLIQNPVNFLIENRIKYISVPHIIKDDLKYIIFL